jgi:hypothetical protein
MNIATSIGYYESFREESCKREILRRVGIHWDTLRKTEKYSEPP